MFQAEGTARKGPEAGTCLEHLKNRKGMTEEG